MSYRDFILFIVLGQGVQYPYMKQCLLVCILLDAYSVYFIVLSVLFIVCIALTVLFIITYFVFFIFYTADSKSFP